MIEGIDMNRLIQICNPRYFKKGEYICQEGDIGHEMYLILQGKVAIYINSFVEENIFVSQAEAGGFFGEMALFGDPARSATCIAQEDTTCVAVNRGNLHQLITSCPEVTERLLVALSNRIRQMNDRVYKTQGNEQEYKCVPLSVPAFHADSAHSDKSDESCLFPVSLKCPFCESMLHAQQVHIMVGEKYKILKSQRKIYERLDPLWHFVRRCPECGYSNYYVNFSKVPQIEKSLLEQVLEEQNKKLGKHFLSPFSEVTADYYRAIHFNECFNAQDPVLKGKLWLYLGWLYEDAGNKKMCLFCHEKALGFYEETYREKPFLLLNEYCHGQCAMVIAELYWEQKEYKKALVYYHAVAAGNHKTLAQQAYDRIYERRDMKSSL